ncbi:epsilon-sarcoglycan isoform X1 [Thrips palmi]|uniref:Epsilon-sarcoglycan isoform X1 n=1 Tax=Thrips palmi TaxID=161013 RepID=A0A6P9ACN5_THRPL|nr:epsilon-sarcoglycan isoform X1 [Thrips palmi]
MSFLSFIVFLLFAVSTTLAVEEDPKCKEPNSKCVVSTKVFTMKVAPQLFKWEASDDQPDRYSYQPSLKGSPDLPSWMQYIYSKTYHSGFIYGTPPANQADFTLEIVAVDLQSYNTSQRTINFVVLPRKAEPARHQVHLKIYNLAVEDLFDPHYLDDLLSIFRAELWTEAIHDLHVSFFASAVHLGARLPLRPDEKEGVVVFLSSAANFSENLLRLENETKPLEKLRKQSSCPRDFKRTTVDRLFRQLNFEVDWCEFELVRDTQPKEDSYVFIDKSLSKTFLSLNLPLWHSPSRSEVPERSYVHEFLLSILVPMLVMIILAILLSLILCFHHEGINKRNQDTPAVQMVRYAAVQRATSTLRSLSAQRDSSPALSRLAPERHNIFGPNPPPYNSGTRSSKIDF